MNRDSRTTILVAISDGLLRDILLDDTQMARLESMGHVTLPDPGETVDRTFLIDHLGRQDVLITGWGCPSLDDEILAAADQLKFVGHCAGSIAELCPDPVFDKVDVVVSGNDAMAQGVVEYCLCTTILGLRHFHVHCRHMRREKDWFPGRNEKLVCGKSVKGSTVGIIGLGEISRGLIPYLNELGAHVLVYSNHADPEEMKTLGATLVDLDTLLKQSDCVHLLCSLRADTLRMMDADALAKLKDGCVLINAGRGALVDEQALIAELETGRISAVLDVYAQEPLSADSPLRLLDNVFTTPHIGSYTHEKFFGVSVIDQLEEYLDGKIPSRAFTKTKARSMTDNRVAKRNR